MSKAAAKARRAGIAAPAPKAKDRQRNGERGKKQTAAKEQKLAGLTEQQNANINAQQNIDTGLYQGAQNMLPGAIDAYSQPFQFNGPAAPVTGDYNAWVGDQMANYNKAFDDRMNPQFQKDLEDFDAMAANKGWDQNGELYQKQKKLLLESQNDARTQAYAQNQSQATNSAGQLFNVGQAAHQGAYGEQLDARNRPWSELNQIMGSASGMNTQNLGYNQARGLQQQDFQNQKWMMQNTPRGGGGGGGGGGAGPLWQQYGFKSPMEYDAYKTQMARDNATWDYQNNPQYRQASGPSASSQFGGQILGTGLGLLGMYAGKNWF